VLTDPPVASREPHCWVEQGTPLRLGSRPRQPSLVALMFDPGLTVSADQLPLPLQAVPGKGCLQLGERCFVRQAMQADPVLQKRCWAVPLARYAHTLAELGTRLTLPLHWDAWLPCAGQLCLAGQARTNGCRLHCKFIRACVVLMCSFVSITRSHQRRRPGSPVALKCLGGLKASARVASCRDASWPSSLAASPGSGPCARAATEGWDGAGGAVAASAEMTTGAPRRLVLLLLNTAGAGLSTSSNRTADGNAAGGGSRTMWFCILVLSTREGSGGPIPALSIIVAMLGIWKWLAKRSSGL
jgi:hypothetical protein